MKNYPAPWSTLLKIVSVLATLLLLGLAFFPLTAALRAPGLFLGVRIFLLALLPGCALFTVRGYRITPEAILVQRLFWTTRLPRAGLQTAAFVPNAMRGSLRTCGIGGLFSFSGFFWSKTLRAYRAYVTDQSRTVILRYADRTVVVSPGQPENFVRELAL